MDLDHATRAYTAAREAVDAVRAENAERLRRARESVETARATLASAIASAYLNDGLRVGELASRTGYTRETIRVILNNAGIERTRD